MRQEYPMSQHEYNTSYGASSVKMQSQMSGHRVQDLVTENARAQEMKEQQTSELAPGAYMMGKIVESNGSRYRSGRGDHGRYMTTDDYANLYRSRRVRHVNEQTEVADGDDGASIMETQRSRVASPAYTQRNTQREQPVRSVRESGDPSRRGSAPSAPTEVRAARAASVPQTQRRPQATIGAGTQRAGKAPTATSMPSTGKASTAPVVRRTTAPTADWLPSGERYIRVQNQKRFPIAMVMMIVAVSVSLMLIVCGSVMTSHMERRVCAMNNELRELNALAEELEGELALKNDPVKMEQLATELGMIRSEYVEMRYLQVDTEERTVIYETEEPQALSLSTLLSAMGFFKD